MIPAAGRWIESLGLARHPEGGWYHETYRSPEQLGAGKLPPRFSGSRSFSTAILFLLEGRDFSALHRLKSDEVWHFHDGAPLLLFQLGEGEGLTTVVLGRDPARGEVPQAAVRAGAWFGARVSDPSSFTLVGCTVAPGFDFADFELGRRERLTALFPGHADLIHSLTRG